MFETKELDDSNLNLNERYRNVIRSKILKRIYDKQDDLAQDEDPDADENVPSTSKNLQNNIQNNLFISEQEDVEEKNVTLNQKIKRQLSSDWRKTLERVLNYSDGYLDGKLDVTRKDAIKFFINTDWPDDSNVDESEQDEYCENSVLKRKKKKKPKKILQTNRAIQPEFNPDQLFVLRRPRELWPQMNSQNLDSNSKIRDINSILTNEFYIDSDEIIISNEDLLERLENFLGPKSLVRLIRERIDLNQFTTIDFITNFQERFLLQEPDRSMNQDLILNRCEITANSKLYKFLNKTLNFFHQGQKEKSLSLTTSLNNDQTMNNCSFILSISDVKLDFHKHPLMEAEDKIVKKLTTAFSRYKKSISTQTKQKFDKLQQQIDLIKNKLQNHSHQEDKKDEHTINKELNMKEISMDLNLLERLLKQKDQLIMERRKSLIELLQQWSRFQNNLDKYPNDNELNEIDLKLDEIEQIDSEQEKDILNQSISKRIDLQNLIHKLKNNSNNIQQQIQEIKDNCYLDDGRLPGEPKFKLIDLILPNGFQKIDSTLNILYSLEILIGNKIVTTFENKNLNRLFSLSWDNCHKSFPVPICFEQTYAPTNEDGELNFSSKLPKIRIHEKNLTTKSLRNVGEIQLNSLPSLKINSKDISIKLEERFQDVEEEEVNKKNRKTKLEATIQFQMYWSSLPSTNNIKSDLNSSMDLFWMYDEDKRRIKQLGNLSEIDQWLHDIRYHVDGSDERSLSIVGIDQQYHRHIELMQLLLRQKYQLELASIYEEKKQQLNKLSRKKKQNQDSIDKPLSEDGTFCDDDYINSNKRFQMMVNRNRGHINYLNYRFMPLTSTDLLLLSDVPVDDSGKSSTKILLEFIRTSCEQQRNRLIEDQNDMVKVSHEWCSGDIQWFSSVIRVLHQIWEQSIRFDDHSGNFIDEPSSKICKEIYFLDEIVREHSFEAISMDFPLLNLFQPPASNRKLNPTRRNRRREAIGIVDAINRDVQIHLLIQHATNVPLKINNNADAIHNGSKTNRNKDLVLSQCSSFVEIKIENTNQTMCTSISDGEQPNWNESFKFKTKFHPKNNIILNLFVVNKSESSDQDSDSIKFEEFDLSNHDNSKLERYWMGQLKIPLWLLLLQSKLEGSFNIFSPYFIRSYRNFRKSNQLFSLDTNVLYGRRRSLDLDSEESSGKFSKNVEKVWRLYSKDGTEYSSQLGSLPDIRLSLFVTTDPPVESSLMSTQNFQSLESIELIDYCERWLQPLRNRFPQRRFICLVDNLQYKSILAIRFISPLKPPPFDELCPVKLDLKSEKKKSKLNKIAHKETLYISLLIRYVSLIPSMFESNSSTELTSRFIDRWSKSNIWLDTVQFLTFRLGCQVEHAILLCCFLLYLDKKAHLILGTSLLDGPTAYVIVYPGTNDDNSSISTTATSLEDNNQNDQKETKSKLILIDPKRGQQFFVHDYHCTMVSVDCIITEDNIYANVQKNSHPGMISYNLSRSNSWHPLFSYKNQMTFSNLDLTIQPQSINYGQQNLTEWTKTIENRLELYLREQFMSWRRQHTGTYTPFNRFCAQVVKRLLPEMERHASFNGHRFYSVKQVQIEDKILDELNQIYDVHKMISYPMNIMGSSAMDFEQLARLIYSTQLHLTHFGMPNQVEYVIACYVHPYPLDVCSIWIYIAALTSKSILSAE